MRLRVVTYNIHRAIGVDRRFHPQRVADILLHLNADVVMLQEVDEGVPRSRELDLAKELATATGYPHYAVGHNVTLRKGRYGNATLSRFPILRERNIDLTIGRRKRRGCQHTRIAVEEPGRRRPHRLEVFNVHLGLSARERHQQLQLLSRSGELTRVPRGVACIVAGDFNDWRSLLVRGMVDELGFSSASGPDGERLRSIPTFPAFFPQGALDRIYYRGALELLWVSRSRHDLAQIASDHLPLIADLELA
jgi:endonuclease/exonuclease/phosphatase family metal-dependent hydrolase